MTSKQLQAVSCRNKKKMEQLEAEKKKFEDQISSAKREVVKRCDQLRSLINSYEKELMKELDEMKVKHLKEIEMRKDEDERHVMMMESYKKYCEEMIEKATACDISRAADDLHVRAVELIKTQEMHNRQEVVKFEVSFMAAPLITDADVKKLFGTIHSSVSQTSNTSQSVTPVRGINKDYLFFITLRAAIRLD